MIWQILKIEKTKDKKAITRAYRELLSKINPEEKPDEFKELRAAYEEALARADEVEKPQEEKSDIELWNDRLLIVYNDLKKRLSINEWKELLAEDICVALDTKFIAEEALLDFLMEHYQISHSVMLFLENHFEFIDRQEELSEKYPADFIDYLVNKAKYEDNFPFEMFVPGIDGQAADRYKEVYNRVINATSKEEAMPYYEELRNSMEQHPYGESRLIRLRILEGDKASLKDLEALSAKWPEDIHIASDLMLEYKDAGLFDKAEKIANYCLEMDENLRIAKQIKAEAAAAKGDYKLAIKLIDQLMKSFVGDSAYYGGLSKFLDEWNKNYKSFLEEKLKEDYSDTESLFDLIWCCIEENNFEKAEELAGKLPESIPDPFSYYNLYAVLASKRDRHKEAEDYLRKLLEVIESLQPDGTEKTLDRIKRKPEIEGRIAFALYNQGKKDEAVEMIETILSENNLDLQLLFPIMQMYLKSDRFVGVSEIADMILDREPANSGAFYYKALAHYMLGQDNIAFDLINEALYYNSADLSSYLLKLLILTRNNALEPAKEIISFLENNGVENDPTVDYCRLVIFCEEDDGTHSIEDYDNMIDIAGNIEDVLAENGQDAYTWASHFYYAYSYIIARIAELYYKDLDKDASQALKYYDKLIELDPKNADNHFYAGMCHHRMEQPLEAEKHFLMEQELEPDYIDGYFRLSYVYLKQNRLEDAIIQGKKSAEMSKIRDENTVRFWRPLILAYRRAGRMEEALETVNQCKEYNPSWDCNDIIFGIYMQAGMFEEAEDFLSKCKASSKNSEDSRFASSRIMLDIAKEDYTGLKLDLQEYDAILDADDRKLAESILAAHNGDLIKYCEAYERYYNFCKAKDELGDYNMGQYAWALYTAGRVEESRMLAERVLSDVEKLCCETSGARLLYKSRMIRLLAILGKEDEARKLIKEANNTPLCEICEYGACKDIYSFMIEVEIISENYAMAEKLCDEAHKKWPEEPDFIEYKFIAKIKGRK